MCRVRVGRPVERVFEQQNAHSLLISSFPPPQFFTAPFRFPVVACALLLHTPPIPPGFDSPTTNLTARAPCCGSFVRSIDQLHTRRRRRTDPPPPAPARRPRPIDRSQCRRRWWGVWRRTGWTTSRPRRRRAAVSASPRLREVNFSADLASTPTTISMSS